MLCFSCVIFNITNTVYNIFFKITTLLFVFFACFCGLFKIQKRGTHLEHFVVEYLSVDGSPLNPLDFHQLNMSP